MEFSYNSIKVTFIFEQSLETTEKNYISNTENDKMNVIINFDKNRNDF